MNVADPKWSRLAAMLILASVVCSGAGVCVQKTSPSPRTVEKLADIAKAYSIDIVATAPPFPITTTHGEIGGSVADAEVLESYTGLFAKEFTLYPRSLVKRSQLKRVVLCKDLAFAGQLRTAIPDYEHDTLYLDVHRGMPNTLYLRKVLHHEFFHIIDYRDDGLVYRDDCWAALNPPEFLYGNGGRNVQDQSDTSVLTDKFPGFLNHYSTTGVQEDKAEIFANLIVDPAYVANRAGKEGVLNAKVQQMRKLLINFCPEMTDEFWEKVRSKGPVVCAAVVVPVYGRRMRPLRNDNALASCEGVIDGG